MPRTIAAVLDAERQRQDLSVNALAKRCDLSPGSVHPILTGDTPNPGVLTVQVILAGLGKSLAWMEKQCRAELEAIRAGGKWVCPDCFSDAWTRQQGEIKCHDCGAVVGVSNLVVRT